MSGLDSSGMVVRVEQSLCLRSKRTLLDLGECMVASLEGRVGGMVTMVDKDRSAFIGMEWVLSFIITLGSGPGADSLLTDLGRKSSNSILHSDVGGGGKLLSTGTVGLREPLVFMACLSKVFRLAEWDSML